MLADLQQAMADLVASSARVATARSDPERWLDGYALSGAERARLRGFLAQPGLVLGCMVYRANRLAPVAMNLTELCRAVGPALRDAMDAFWTAHPHQEPNPLLECRRFCDFLAAWPRTPATALAALPEARATIAAALATATVALRPAPSAPPPASPSAPSSPSGSAGPALPAPARSPPPPPGA